MATPAHLAALALESQKDNQIQVSVGAPESVPVHLGYPVQVQELLGSLPEALARQLTTL